MHNDQHDNDQHDDWQPGYDVNVYIGSVEKMLTSSADRLITIAAGLVGTGNDSAVCGVLGIASGLLGISHKALHDAEVPWTD